MTKEKDNSRPDESVRPGFAVNSGRGQASRRVRYVEYSHPPEGCNLCREEIDSQAKNTPGNGPGAKGSNIKDDGADDRLRVSDSHSKT